MTKKCMPQEKSADYRYVNDCVRELQYFSFINTAK